MSDRNSVHVAIRGFMTAAESEIAVTKVSSTLTLPLIDCKNTKTPAENPQLYKSTLATYYNGGHTSS